MDTDRKVQLDRSKLNEIGRDRIENGFTCYLSPGRDGCFVAVCTDLGLSARGASFDDAKRNLHRVLIDFLETAQENGYLEEFLNRPSNKVAVQEMLSLLFAWKIANAMFRGFQFLRCLTNIGGRVERYREHPDQLCHYSYA